MSEFNFDEWMAKLRGQACKAKDEAERITKSVVKKTNSMVGQAKINYAIGETEDKIKEILIELGEMVYEEYCQADDIVGEIGEKCGQINRLHEEIDALKDKLAELKDTVRCAACGGFNPSTNAYCAACGQPLVQEEPEEEPQEDTSEQADE